MTVLRRVLCLYLAMVLQGASMVCSARGSSKATWIKAQRGHEVELNNGLARTPQMGSVFFSLLTWDEAAAVFFLAFH